MKFQFLGFLVELWFKLLSKGKFNFPQEVQLLEYTAYEVILELTMLHNQCVSRDVMCSP